jgi:hypothetical protein
MTAATTEQNRSERRQLLGFLTLEHAITLGFILVTITAAWVNLSSRMDSIIDAQRRQEMRDSQQDSRLDREEDATSDRRVWEARMEATSLRIEAKVDTLRDVKNDSPQQP